MAFTKNMVMMMMMMLAFLMSGSSMAATYQVGDSSGWTNQGTDYKSWASSKKFYSGDILVFNYEPGSHNNVVQVTKKDYEACSATSPIATYTSGSDSIKLSSPEKYYFICSYPGMCEQGQKLKIKVSSGTSKTPPVSPSTNSTPATPSLPPITYQGPPGVIPNKRSGASSIAPVHYHHLAWLVVFASFVWRFNPH